MSMQVNHVGIILDGNRRFAKKMLLESWKGHEYGTEKVEQLFDWCKELDIKELTLYIFSMQNFNRSKTEVSYLMDLFCKFFSGVNIREKIKDNGIAVRFIGRTRLLPQKVQETIHKLEDETKHHKTFKVNFAMAYGGREEIIDGIKRLMKEGIKEVDENTFSKYLYLQNEPDLIIRTGGDKRTSNFLVWQSWYSEWFFVDKYWPELEKEDLAEIVEEFSQRQRRFGK